jgi:hypothetical protein
MLNLNLWSYTPITLQFLDKPLTVMKEEAIARFDYPEELKEKPVSDLV